MAIDNISEFFSKNEAVFSLISQILDVRLHVILSAPGQSTLSPEMLLKIKKNRGDKKKCIVMKPGDEVWEGGKELTSIHQKTKKGEKGDVVFWFSMIIKVMRFIIA